MEIRSVLLFVIGCLLPCELGAVTNTTSSAVTTDTNTPVTTTSAIATGTENTTITAYNTTTATKQTTPKSIANQLVTIKGQLVRLVDNCTVGDDSTCHYNYCCTKKYMQYPASYFGDRPVYQLECKPLRKKGEFCYFNTPEQFCPCSTRCHTNGFYGSCI